VAQYYIDAATGKLTALNTINDIAKNEETKYYSLKNYYIDKRMIGVHPSFDVSGKYSEDFNMHLYVVLPIMASEADTASKTCLAWLGAEYYKRISNNLDEKEKETEYQKFAASSQVDFDQKDFSQFVYLDRIADSEDRDGYLEAVKANKWFAATNPTILLPQTEPFEARMGKTFEWIFGAFAIGAVIWLIMISFPTFNEEELHKLESGIKTEDTELKEFVGFLLPKEGYFITPILIYLNIIIFIVMVTAGLGFISFKSDDLLAWGANYRPLTEHGEWWRLLTSIFLHGGIMHVLANMYGLFFVGVFLEPLLGKVKYTIIYLLTGIISSLASIWWYEATVSVGASGAIFGLYGLFLALLLLKLFPPDFGKAFLTSTLIFVGYNLFVGLAGSGIDNAAHIGGLVSGFLIGLALAPSLKRKQEELAAELENSSVSNDTIE